MTGIIVKGGANRIFNNTIFDIGNRKKTTIAWKQGGLIIETNQGWNTTPWQFPFVACHPERRLVEDRGIEPLTFRLPA